MLKQLRTWPRSRTSRGRQMNEMEIQNLFYPRNSSRFSMIVPNCYPVKWFECDLLCITHAGFMCEYEIKLTLADFLADAKKGYGPVGPSKHELLAKGDVKGPSKFWFIVPDTLKVDVPDFAGLLRLNTLPDKGSFGWFTAVKKAPRLHKTKMSESTKDILQKNLCFRYWRQRLNQKLPLL